MVEGTLEVEYRKIAEARKWLEKSFSDFVPGREEALSAWKALKKAQETLNSFVSNPRDILKELSSNRHLRDRKVPYEENLFMSHKSALEAINGLIHKARRCSPETLAKAKKKIEHGISRMSVLVPNEYYNKLLEHESSIHRIYKHIQESLQYLQEAVHFLTSAEYEYLRTRGLLTNYRLSLIIPVVDWPWVLI